MNRIFLSLPVLMLLCGFAACRRTPTALAEPASAPTDAPEQDLRARLAPGHAPLPPLAVAPFAAPASSSPTTIFPAPVRSWLPPASTEDKPRMTPAELRTGQLPPLSSNEVPPLPVLQNVKQHVPLPTVPLAEVAGADPTLFTTWIVSNPAPEARTRPPNWDQPRATTELAGAPPLDFAPAAGLRETAAPFLRLVIPDPFEQLALAELRNPPVEAPAPVFAIPRPPISLPESTIVAAGK